METLLKSLENESLIFLILSFCILIALFSITIYVLKKYGKNPNYLLPGDIVSRTVKPIFLLFLSVLIRLKALHEILHLTEYTFLLQKASTLLLIFSITWLALMGLKIVKHSIIKSYDVNVSDNLKARKIYTQFNILERIAVVIVIIIALAIALMSFQGIREIGVSIFASAGIAGIIIGLSAQKMIASILAGIQVAIAQPIKLDDVVIVEGEWGRIEEITLTYVVVNIWDKRRLIVPTTYFIEKPFQNWTKSSSEILGTVFLYTDYNVPFDKLREELTKILSSTELWDGKVNVLQVTESKPQSVEIRALMSAKDSPTAWDLRVLVREKLIVYLQQNYPESLAHSRIYLKNKDKTKMENAN